jgi:exopolyphosphatase/guanosine-5'-triphosphate,3'-diphosphate pyrophosphatase
MTTETLAVIDLGTNTFQMLLVRADHLGHFKVLKRISSPVKLGEGGFHAGHIAPAAFERGIEALKEFRRLMNHAAATRALAVATSAIRSASNGRAFVETALYQAGIPIRIIEGEEEARLIHEGVVAGLRLPKNETSLLMDIGGGSVEFIVSANGVPLYMRSLELGAARLLERFSLSDPIEPQQYAAMHAYISAQLQALQHDIAPFLPIVRLVGSSSTFKTLGLLVSHQKNAHISREMLNGYTFTRTDFAEIAAELIPSCRADRLLMYEMKKSRVEMMAAATVLVEATLAAFPSLQAVTVATSALREGVLHHYLKQKHRL